MAAGRGCGGRDTRGLPDVAAGCRNVPAGRLRGVPAWHAAALIAETSPTRADRQLRPHVAAGPSCRLYCRHRTPHCASRTSRPPERRPRPAAGSWWSAARPSVSYRRVTGQRQAVRITPPAAPARDAPSLARSPVSPRPRRRDHIAGPGHARRLRGARHLPEHRSHDGSGAGSGLDQNVQGDHVTPPGLLCLFNPHSPAESSPPQVPGRRGPDQVPRSLNDGPRPVIAPGQSDR